jgi:hypothetical protein
MLARLDKLIFRKQLNLFLMQCNFYGGMLNKYIFIA